MSGENNEESREVWRNFRLKDEAVEGKQKVMMSPLFLHFSCGSDKSVGKVCLKLKRTQNSGEVNSNNFKMNANAQ